MERMQAGLLNKGDGYRHEGECYRIQSKTRDGGRVKFLRHDANGVESEQDYPIWFELDVLYYADIPAGGNDLFAGL